jgi:hypothetical protein
MDLERDLILRQHQQDCDDGSRDEERNERAPEGLL